MQKWCHSKQGSTTSQTAEQYIAELRRLPTTPWITETKPPPTTKQKEINWKTVIHNSKRNRNMAYF